MDDPEQLQALTDATDPNAQGGVVEVANLEETYDPAEYDQEVVNVIDENKQVTRKQTDKIEDFLLVLYKESIYCATI